MNPLAGYDYAGTGDGYVHYKNPMEDEISSYALDIEMNVLWVEWDASRCIYKYLVYRIHPLELPNINLEKYLGGTISLYGYCCDIIIGYDTWEVDGVSMS